MTKIANYRSFNSPYFEIIQNIEEVFNVNKDGEENTNGSTYDGIRVTTDKQVIHLLISNDISCCESIGYFFSNDNYKDFIGADLQEISKTDKFYNKEKMNLLSLEGYEQNIVFIDLDTSEGTLQIAVYNVHNGYYGHDVIFKSDELKFESII